MAGTFGSSQGDHSIFPSKTHDATDVDAVSLAAHSCRMRKGIIWLAVTLLMAGIGLGLLWQQQSNLADAVLARYLPQLRYDSVTLNAAQGRLILRTPHLHLPGIGIDGGEATIDVDPEQLLNGVLVVRKVVVNGMTVALNPAQIVMPTGTASADAVPQPEQVVFQNLTLHIKQDWLPMATPLNLLSGEIHKWGKKGQLLTAKLALNRESTITLRALLDGEQASGSITSDGAPLPELLRQAGINLGTLRPDGSLQGTLQWSMALHTPEQFEISGNITIKDVSAHLLNATQALGTVQVEARWQGTRRLLEISRLSINKAKLFLRQNLHEINGPSITSVANGSIPPIAWRLRHLNMQNVQLNLELQTSVGRMQLPLTLRRAVAEEISSHSLRPQRVSAKLRLYGGKGILQIEGRKLRRLSLQDIALPKLNPLMLETTGLRALDGDLDLDLNGVLRPYLRLVGKARMHHLVLAPRIPIDGVDSSIPFAFGLRALTDDNGITLVPLLFRGTLAQPELETDLVVSKVKENLMNDPLDGGYRHLAIDFRSGSVTPTPTGHKRLNHLSTELRRSSRPAHIELRGCVDGKTHLSDRAGQRLAAARVTFVRKILRRAMNGDGSIRVIYPGLTRASPDILGKKDRVEVTIAPQRAAR